MLKKKKNYLKYLDLDLFGVIIKRKVVNSIYFKQIYLSYFFFLIKKPLHLLLIVERPFFSKLKKNIYKKNMFYLKKVLIYFYRNIKLKKFLNIIKKNRNKSLYNIFSKLELRLDMVLYRFFLSTISLGEIKQKIINKKILVNFNIITNIHYEVKVNDIISLEKNYSKLIYKKMKIKMLSKKFFNKFFRNPFYLFIDYNKMVCLIYKKPLLNELPFFFDVNFKNIKTLGYRF